MSNVAEVLPLGTFRCFVGVAIDEHFTLDELAFVISRYYVIGRGPVRHPAMVRLRLTTYTVALPLNGDTLHVRATITFVNYNVKQ